MLSLNVEEHSSLENRCNELLGDVEIRFTGVINKMGNLVAGGFDEGVEPFQSDEKQRMLYMQMVLEISMRREFNLDLGEVNYTASNRNRALMITIPFDDKIILVSATPDASTERIVGRINYVFYDSVGETK
ncbi:MAG: DUF6659 family protein [Nitrosopumilus sp.]